MITDTSVRSYWTVLSEARRPPRSKLKMRHMRDPGSASSQYTALHLFEINGFPLASTCYPFQGIFDLRAEALHDLNGKSTGRSLEGNKY